MKYHALFIIFEKAANMKLSSAANIGGALMVNYIVHITHDKNVFHAKIRKNYLSSSLKLMGHHLWFLNCYKGYVFN